jgi:hypothetical protein
MEIQERDLLEVWRETYQAVILSNPQDTGPLEPPARLNNYAKQVADTAVDDFTDKVAKLNTDDV